MAMTVAESMLIAVLIPLALIFLGILLLPLLFDPTPAEQSAVCGCPDDGHRCRMAGHFTAAIATYFMSSTPDALQPMGTLSNPTLGKSWRQ